MAFLSMFVPSTSSAMKPGPRLEGVSNITNGALAVHVETPRIPAVRNRLTDTPVAGHKRVLLAAPRGYCAGVDRAVIAVEKALEHVRLARLRAQADRAQHPRGVDA
jgi:hypothetical protein